MTDRSPTEAEEARTERLATLGELGAGVIHESRNTLTGVLGFAQVALRGTLDAPTRHMIELIEQETARCVEILRSFLEYANVADRRPVPVCVGRLVDRTCELVQMKLRLMKADLVLDRQPGLPTLLGVPGELQQALVNLLLNAAHASPAGGTIRVYAQVLERDGVDGVEISVHDSGPGVPRGQEHRIFDPFYTTKPAGEGTGLGLAISRRIVEAHGGCLGFTNASEGGARFFLWIPCPEVALDDACE